LLLDAVEIFLLMRPAVNSPTASKAETMVRSLPFQLPGLIVPP
jgi:hypothetical protein